MLNQKLMGAFAPEKTYIEDFFSTYLYTGNGSTQTINNEIDLAGKGGMVWIKARSNAYSNVLFDTTRGISNYLSSDQTINQNYYGSMFSLSENSTGFSISSDTNGSINQSGTTYASWTFRKAPKFFDVVTYTGDGTTNRAISHSLGQAPGMIIVKCISTTGNWGVRHFGIESGNYYPTGGYSANLNLLGSFSNNDFFAQDPSLSAWTNSFKVNSNGNLSGNIYVAYLFAHDTTTNGLIQCGSYTGNGSATGPSVTLGWEPQWLMIKNATGTGNWQIIDNMRGMPVGSADATLQANLNSAESSVEYVSPTATGFQVTSTSTEVNTSGSTYIYMAIRRGPMRTPTDGTKVFKPLSRTGTGVDPTLINFTLPTDLFISRDKTASSWIWADRMRGIKYFSSNSASAEAAINSIKGFDSQSGVIVTDDANGFGVNKLNMNLIHYGLRRAPGFFDVVCYTGTGAARTVKHNLGVAPELMIVKQRNDVTGWLSYWLPLGNTMYAQLNSNFASGVLAGAWNNTTPTSTVFTVGTETWVNALSGSFVAYLFASCPGVSKVGSFTGNGSTQTINCGFTNGARFVLIKRTDSTSNWMVWDTARGITTTSDPLLLLNSTAAETSGADQIQPNSTGFTVQYAGPSTDSAPNMSGATYIYLAIA